MTQEEQAEVDRLRVLLKQQVAELNRDIERERKLAEKVDAALEKLESAEEFEERIRDKEKVK